MRYKVTGGADGKSGIEVAERRYEPGDIVDMTAAKAEWLVAQGYLVPADAKAKAEPTPEPTPEPVVETQETE